ncbi:MAG: murein transglycosylase A [Lewinellaceae bacterium]|nr:murein transglycosylase A [Phaeodactylibacter sp.]MCB9040914.1 murein transglycosylase A [Lewinellaceae bacterium]
MNKHKTLIIIFLVFLFGCEQPIGKSKPSATSGEGGSLLEGEEGFSSSPRLRRDGRLGGLPKMADVYEPAPLDTFDLPIIDEAFVDALKNSLELLRLQQRKRNQQVGGLRITYEELDEAIRTLIAWQHTKPLGLHEHLEAYQIWGADQRSNVRFTGYFTPVVKVRKEPKGAFQHPLYDRPLEWEGSLPTRREIEGEHLLKGMELELAYAADKVDVYYMQVQGSGFVEYPNGQLDLFAYNGTNRHPYRSIEKYIIGREDLSLNNLSIGGIRRYLKQNPALRDTILFQNPSYTFFARKRSGVPKGAGSVPLTAGYSIAVDRRYIPLGSCLLAAFPVYDREKHRVIRHEYRFLAAQDVGGAIKGAGHIDLYTGVGSEAAREAGRINQYGRLWLLLPKPARAQFISAEE